MPVILQCDNLAVAREEVGRLWKEAAAYRRFADEQAVVRCVGELEMQRLNKEYRGRDTATNILTFSYDTGEHDVALCVAVAEREAQVRGVAVRDYVALLLTHAFLHAMGMDHERSDAEAQEMRDAEEEILRRSGFSPIVL